MAKLKKDFWLMPLFASFAFLFAAGLHKPLLWFLFNLCMLCILITLIYRWRNWLNIDIDRIIDKKQASVEAGANLEVSLNALTTSLLPWPWIEIKDIIPESISEHTKYTLPQNFVLVRKGKSRQSEYTIPKVRRGVYSWETIEYKSGDLLGFTSYTGRISKPVRLIVYPKTVELSIDTFFPKQAHGSVTARKAFQLDREQPVGIRDYQTGDGFSRIAWKSTAKMGKLQSKEFETLINDSFRIVLDCSATTWEQGYDPAFEEAITVAASFVKASISAHNPVTFYSNSDKRCRQIYVDSRTSYYNFLLETAFINSNNSDNITTLLHKTVFSQNNNMILVSSRRGIGLEKVLKQRAQRGNFNTLVLINKSLTAKDYNDIKETGFYKRIIINKAEDLALNINRR